MRSAHGFWAWWREADLTRPALGGLALLGGGFLIHQAWFHANPLGLDPGVVITPTFALIGGVVGHHFQSRLTDRAQRDAEEARLDLRLVREVAEAYERKIEELRAALADAQRVVEGRAKARGSGEMVNGKKSEPSNEEME